MVDKGAFQETWAMDKVQQKHKRSMIYWIVHYNVNVVMSTANRQLS